MTSIQTITEDFERLSPGDPITATNSWIQTIGPSTSSVASRTGQGTAMQPVGSSGSNQIRLAGTGVVSFDFMVSALPASTSRMFAFMRDSGYIGRDLYVTTAGALAYKSGTKLVPSLTMGQWYRFEVEWNQAQHIYRVWSDPSATTGAPDYTMTTNELSSVSSLYDRVAFMGQGQVVIDNIVTSTSDTLAKYQGGRTVAIIGDFITEASGNNTLSNAIVANGYDIKDVHWNAAIGRCMEFVTDQAGLNTGWSIDGAKLSLYGDPLWVLALGTGDAMASSTGDPEAFDTIIDTALNKIGSGQTILIPTIVHRDGLASFTTFNERLRAAKLRHIDKRVIILDWETYAKAQSPSIFTGSYVTYTPEGNTLRTAFIADAIGAPGKWDTITGPRVLGVWNGSTVDPASLLGVWDGGAVKDARIVGVKSS